MYTPTMQSIQKTTERSQRPPRRAGDTQFSHEAPSHAELEPRDAARLRALLEDLRSRYPIEKRIGRYGNATNRGAALAAASILMADPGAFIDALVWSLDEQYGHAGRGGASA